MSEFLRLPRGIIKRMMLFLLAFMYVAIGIRHFTDPGDFVAIVPPYLPEPLLLVHLSGIAEILVGLGVIPFTSRKWAGWGILALLIAVFPANIHMALNPQDFPNVDSTFVYARLPVQFLFAAWAWWATQPDAETAA